MSSLDAWNTIYQNRQQLSVWPWSDLVSQVKRLKFDSHPSLKVLELGCGAGANIPFFLSLNADYYAIEGSEWMVNQLVQRFPQYEATIKCADFTLSVPFDTSFDLVVDRASLTHNTTPNIKRCLKKIAERLVDQGVFIGIDWFSTLHSDYILGDVMDDCYSKKNIQEGQFKEVGCVHFSDESHIEELFSPFFIIEKLEHKKIDSISKLNGGEHCSATWNIIARKVNT